MTRPTTAEKGLHDMTIDCSLGAGTVLDVFVPGDPAPQGSKRHVGRGILVESSKAVGPWRERVALAAHHAGHTQQPGPVSVELSFVMRRPKSAPKRRTPAATKRPDLDKLARACLDAITGITIIDDAQITDLRARKRLAEIGEQPGVHIRVQVIG